MHDHDPNASLPKLFAYEVDENCEETCAEGINMFHNPNALHPVPEEQIPSEEWELENSSDLPDRFPRAIPFSCTSPVGMFLAWNGIQATSEL